MRAISGAFLGTVLLCGSISGTASAERPWDKVEKGAATAAVWASKEAVRALPDGLYQEIANKGYLVAPDKTQYQLADPTVLVPGGAAAAGTTPPLGPQRPTLQERVDLGRGFPGVRDQGGRDTSVAFAALAAMEYALHQPDDLSEQYAYWLFKNAETGPARCRDGASLFEAARLLHQDGVPVESDWPYATLDPRELFREDCFKKETWSNGQPPGEARRGARYYIKSYSVIRDAANPLSLLAALDAGHPVVFATGIAGTHWHAWTYITPVIDIMVDKNKKPVVAKGSHTIVLVGYDLDKKAFKFRNSWGYRWGKEGYHWLAFDYVKVYGQGAWYITEVGKK